MARDLQMWTNGNYHVAAKDLDDVRAVLAEHLGPTAEEDVQWEMDEGFEPVADDIPLTIENHDGKGARMTMTCAGWIERDGRGVHASQEY